MGDDYDYFEEALADGLVDYGIVEDDNYDEALDLTSVIYDDMYNGKVRSAADKVMEFNNRHKMEKSERLDLVMKLSKIALEARDAVMGDDINENELDDIE